MQAFPVSEQRASPSKVKADDTLALKYMLSKAKWLNRGLFLLQGYAVALTHLKKKSSLSFLVQMICIARFINNALNLVDIKNGDMQGLL